MKPIRTVGLIANPHKPEAVTLAARLVTLLGSRSVSVRLSPETAALLEFQGSAAAGAPGDPVTTGNVAELGATDMVLVLGGDGTLLHAIRQLAGAPVPLLGVNVGNLGFLTEVSAAEIDEALEPVLRGDYALSTRPLLEGVVEDAGGRETARLSALNDVVVDAGGAFRRAVHLKMALGGEEVGRFTADGVVVATPAGSTAYSLSAGGPILDPGVATLVATPICPHMMTVRPLVYADTQILTVEDMRPDLHLKATADGQVHVTVPQAGRVRIGLAPERKVHLVTLGRLSYFQVLRAKLRWGSVRKRE